MKKFILLTITLFSVASIKTADFSKAEKKAKAEEVALTQIGEFVVTSIEKGIETIDARSNSVKISKLADALPKFSLDLIKIVASYMLYIQKISYTMQEINPTGELRIRARFEPEQNFIIFERKIRDEWGAKKRYKIEFAPEVMAWSLDSKTLICSDRYAKNFRFWQVDDKTFDLKLDSKKFDIFSIKTKELLLAKAISLHPDKNILAIGTHNGKILILKNKENKWKLIGAIQLFGEILILHWQEDGNKLYVGAFQRDDYTSALTGKIVEFKKDDTKN